VKFRFNFLLVSALAFVSCTGAPQQVAATKTSGPDSEQWVIVDNQDPAMESEGKWTLVQSPTAYNGDCLWAPFWKNPANGSVDSAYYARATTRPKLPQAGMYEVYAWWCGAPVEDRSTKQSVWLCATRGYSCVTIYINPREDAGQWNSLGTYYLDIDADVTVRNGEIRWGAPPGWEIIADGAVVIDAFRFVYRSPPLHTLTPLPFQPYPSPTPAP
jgi:hypothetical protein